MKNGYMTFTTNHIKPQRYYQILSTISKWVFMMFLLRFALSFTFATLYPNTCEKTSMHIWIHDFIEKFLLSTNLPITILEYHGSGARQ